MDDICVPNTTVVHATYPYMCLGSSSLAPISVFQLLIFLIWNSGICTWLQTYLQFLVCGGPSSNLSRAKRAALSERPLIPSPHSFSALQHTHTHQWISETHNKMQAGTEKQ